MRTVILFLACVFQAVFAFSQTNDSLVIKNFFDEALTSRTSYEGLRTLCKTTPHRLAGSEGSFKALDILYNQLKATGADTVYKQAVIVHHWERGNIEEAWIQTSKGMKKNLPCTALGASVATPPNGLTANVVEVKSFDDLKNLGQKKIQGKIVFYNYPMDPTLLDPGRAYGKAAYQRVAGAMEAAKYGAVGVVIRSLTTNLDHFPHTGIMRYNDTITKIPAIAISTIDADELSKTLTVDPALTFYFKLSCKVLPDVESYNLIAELKGSQKPDEIITVGGHTDCWDIGEGANDDGGGCAQSIEVMRLFKALNIRPARTLRVVLFIDEEMYQSGGKQYAKSVQDKGEKIYAALETDGGVSVPRGFSCTANERSFGKFMSLKNYFEPYEAAEFTSGGGGVDIGFLKELNVPLLELEADHQRYFDFHHSANDVFEHISFREMQEGAAAIASLLYLVDKYSVFD